MKGHLVAKQSRTLEEHVVKGKNTPEKHTGKNTRAGCDAWQIAWFPSTPRSRVTRRGPIFLHKDKGYIRSNTRTVLYCLKKGNQISSKEYFKIVLYIPGIRADNLPRKNVTIETSHGAVSVSAWRREGRLQFVLYSSFVRQWRLVL